MKRDMTPSHWPRIFLTMCVAIVALIGMTCWATTRAAAENTAGTTIEKFTGINSGNTIGQDEGIILAENNCDGCHKLTDGQLAALKFRVLGVAFLHAPQGTIVGITDSSGKITFMKAANVAGTTEAFAYDCPRITELTSMDEKNLVWTPAAQFGHESSMLRSAAALAIITEKPVSLIEAALVTGAPCWVQTKARTYTDNPPYIAAIVFDRTQYRIDYAMVELRAPACNVDVYKLKVAMLKGVTYNVKNPAWLTFRAIGVPLGGLSSTA